MPEPQLKQSAGNEPEKVIDTQIGRTPTVKPKEQPSLIEIGKSFVEWLVSEVNNGKLTVNKPDSCVFEPRYGLAILVPNIFMLYESETGTSCDTTQKALLKLKLNANLDGDNIKKGRLPNRRNPGTYILINSPKLLKRIDIKNDGEKESKRHVDS